MVLEGRENKFSLKVWPLAGQSQCSECPHKYMGNTNCNQWVKGKKKGIGSLRKVSVGSGSEKSWEKE